MTNLNLSLTDKEEELLSKIIEKTGGRRQETIREAIRKLYFELYPIRKVSESVVAKKPTSNPVQLTRKEFIEQNIQNMDMEESLKWQKENKEEISKYPHTI